MFKVFTPPNDSMMEAKVSSLIDPEAKCWRWDIIDNVFLPVDADRIKKIPLGDMDKNDDFVWHFHQSGEYAVKSGYQVAFKALHEQSTASSSETDWRKFWRNIWQLPAPPKIANFVWRGCLDIVPTRDVIHRRINTTEPTCQFCYNPESLIHLCRDCPAFKDIWQQQGLPQVGTSTDPNFKAWWIYLAGKLTKREMAAVAIVCYNIWKQRNKAVFEQVPPCLRRLEHTSKFMGNEFVAATRIEEAKQVPDQHKERVTWRCPQGGTVKMNADAGVIKPGSMGMGVIFRDEQGGIIACAQKEIQGTWEPITAEAKALAFGLELAVELNLDHMIAESDCKTLIGYLQSDTRLRTEVGLFVDECMYWKSCFVSCSWSFVPRSGNLAAHRLAKVKFSSNSKHVWVDSFPPNVVRLAEDDVLNNLVVNES